jgi:signal transduction histidine kinase
MHDGESSTGGHVTTTRPASHAAPRQGTALEACLAVATAAAAGPDPCDVIAALLERIAAATGAVRAVLVRVKAGEPPRVLEPAWTAAEGAVSPPHVPDPPEEPAALAAALGLPGATTLPLLVDGEAVAMLVVDGPEPDDLAPLAAVAAPVLHMALRASEAEDRAGRMDRMRSLTQDLMGVVSHELRTPLTAIIGSLQTMQRTPVDSHSPEGKRLVAAALSRAERLRELVEDLLITARPDAPVRSRLRSVDVAAAIRGAVAAVPGAEVVATAEVDPAVGAVLLDGAHLERVLVNLLDNAIRHSEGTPVEITATRDDAELIIDVADHGPGLPPAVARRVLDRGSDDSALRPAASGLGLTITRGLVESMGGRISHLPTPGGGATFRLVFPYPPPGR